MKDFVKSYFTFNRKDRNAFVVILVITVIIALAPFFYNLFITEEPYDFSDFKNDIIAFELEQKRLQEADSLKELKEKENFNFFSIDQSVEKAKLTPFTFNPNNLPAEQWRKLGLNDKQINSIKNFEAKGGRFAIKKDLKKMYLISETEYNTLEPFIDLPDEKLCSPPAVKKQSQVLVTFELNNADSTQLKELKGIGNVLSKRIVRYREKLGGFYKKEQLLEIEGIDTVLYNSIITQLTLEKRLVRKINVNTAIFSDFSGHPYISNNVALSIINYRNMHGPYNELTDVMNSALVTEELFYKISPYLTIGL